VSDNDTGKLLASGIADAVGFVGGALLGYWIGQMLGLDIFADGYGAGSLLGIALVGLGGGLGLHLSKRWQSSQAKASRKE